MQSALTENVRWCLQEDLKWTLSDCLMPNGAMNSFERKFLKWENLWTLWKARTVSTDEDQDRRRLRKTSKLIAYLKTKTRIVKERLK